MPRRFAALAVVLALVGGTVVAVAATPTETALPDDGASAVAASPVDGPGAEPEPSAGDPSDPELSASNEPTNDPDASPPTDPDDEIELDEVERAEEDEEGSGGGPPPKVLNRFIDRLAAAGIATTEAEFQMLVGKVGVGGAVRVLMFADASGQSPSAILAMRDAGLGWGEIRDELDLEISPGIGRIMGGGEGRGRGLGRGGGG